MDIVYLFRHSKFDDVEIRHSLRSVAENLTWVRKVWVFGDRPEFLSDDKSRVEHVPWEAVAWLRHVQAPVRNFFLQCFLVAQHPEVDAEFLLFCDDYILLDHVLIDFYGAVARTAIIILHEFGHSKGLTHLNRNFINATSETPDPNGDVPDADLPCYIMNPHPTNDARRLLSNEADVLD